MVLTLFQIASALAVLLLSIYFDISIGNNLNVYVTLSLYFADGLLLATPLWFLPGKWRRLVPVLITLAAIFFWSNTLYYRYWGDLLTWSLLTDSANYNSFVFRAVPGLLRLSDILFIIIPLALVFLYRYLRVSYAPRPERHKAIVMSIAALVFYLGAQSLSILATLRYYNNKNEASSFAEVLWHKFSTLSNSRLFEWHGNGLFLYSYIQLARDSGHIPQLGDSDEKLISDFFAKRQQLVGCDTIFDHNKGKNLILIIVESLNSWVVGERIGENSLTPVLDSLLLSDGTVSCLTVSPQRKHGGSSDGHFMYNTGLLPISYGSVAMLFADNDYSPANLSRHFSESVDFIIENGSVWNHRATTKAYGYDQLVERIDVTSTPIDSTLFAVVADTIARLQQPFLAEIITLGMHYPFVDSNLNVPEWLRDVDAGDKDINNYYRTVYGFDKALGTFLTRLRDMGLYDRSVIVIASDHDLGVGSHPAEGDITFMALNTGLTCNITRRTGQIDIYPTVCSIMGFDDRWTGLGISMLDSRNNSAVLADGSIVGHSTAAIDSMKVQAWKVSDLIVRSDFFHRH